MEGVKKKCHWRRQEVAHLIQRHFLLEYLETFCFCLSTRVVKHVSMYTQPCVDTQHQTSAQHTTSPPRVCCVSTSWLGSAQLCAKTHGFVIHFVVVRGLPASDVASSNEPNSNIPNHVVHLILPILSDLLRIQVASLHLRQFHHHLDQHWYDFIRKTIPVGNFLLADLN